MSGGMSLAASLPPSDKGGEAHRLMNAALKAQPVGTWLLLLGNLNAGLDCS